MPKLPPDPEHQNDERAAAAKVAIEALQATTGADDVDAVSDLVCYLAHYCDRNGLNAQREFAWGLSLYDSMTAGQGSIARSPASLDLAETSTILAALRHYQDTIHHGTLPDAIADLASDGENIRSLDLEDIDDLCERLNCALDVVPQPSFIPPSIVALHISGDMASPDTLRSLHTLITGLRTAPSEAAEPILGPQVPMAVLASARAGKPLSVYVDGNDEDAVERIDALQSVARKAGLSYRRVAPLGIGDAHKVNWVISWSPDDGVDSEALTTPEGVALTSTREISAVLRAATALPGNPPITGQVDAFLERQEAYAGALAPKALAIDPDLEDAIVAQIHRDCKIAETTPPAWVDQLKLDIPQTPARPRF